MKTAKVSDYRSHLANYHNKILKDHNPLRISGLEGDIIILPANDYENLIENLYILRDKITLKSISDTRNNIKNKKHQYYSLEEAFHDVLGDKSKQTS